MPYRIKIGLKRILRLWLAERIWSVVTFMATSRKKRNWGRDFGPGEGSARLCLFVRSAGVAYRSSNARPLATASRSHRRQPGHMRRFVPGYWRTSAPSASGRSCACQQGTGRRRQAGSPFECAGGGVCAPCGACAGRHGRLPERLDSGRSGRTAHIGGRPEPRSGKADPSPSDPKQCGCPMGVDRIARG